MKKGFSLIELIFTIVIIAMVFTVIPKVIYVTNIGIGFTLKETGLFNMMAKIMDISLKEVDENNTETDDILFTGNNNLLECNSTTDLRIGGFYGGRNCEHDKYVSHIGVDSGETDEYDYDDVDDYNGTESNATKSGYGTRYVIHNFVGYSDEWGSGDYNYNNQLLDFNFTSKRDSSPTSNIKYIYVKLEDKKYDKNISSARYWSANIGHMYIESRKW